MELEPLTWDTELLGVRIARVHGRPDPQPLSDLVRETGTSCLYYRCDAADVDGVRAAERCGFRLADVRVTLETSVRRLAALDRPPRDDLALDRPRPDDRPDLTRIGDELSAHSRFARDPGFGPAQARRLYRRWIEVSLDGRTAVFVVARQAGRVVGLVTGRETEVASFELVAVRERATGRGIGTALLHAAAVALASRGHDRAEVVTQGHNVRALRFYEAAGFTVCDVSLVYHWWAEPARGTS